MTPESIAQLFTALAGGQLQALQREDHTLRFQVLHPSLAANIHPDYTTFFAALTGCTRFDLQPFRNDSTILQDLKPINRLRLLIHSARLDDTTVCVHFVGSGGVPDACLRLRADTLIIMDEAYDAHSAPALQLLRSHPDPAD